MYNGELQNKNITRVLNELHRTLGTHKLQGQLHLVDAYPGCKVGDEAVTQAEGKSLAVAAASIVARAKAIAQFERLSAKAGFRLPKGSTHVAAALKEVVAQKLLIKQFAKLHFKNVQKVLEEGEYTSER
jgi:ribonuclease HII